MIGCDHAAGSLGSSELYFAVDIITSCTPASIAALNGASSVSITGRALEIVTDCSSVLFGERPRPGKCLTVAAVPPSLRPSEKATTCLATWSGSSPKVRALSVDSVAAPWETSATGARSTLTPRPERYSPVDLPSALVALVSSALPISGGDWFGGPARRLTLPPSWSIAIISGGLPPSDAAFCRVSTCFLSCLAPLF